MTTAPAHAFNLCPRVTFKDSEIQKVNIPGPTEYTSKH